MYSVIPTPEFEKRIKYLIRKKRYKKVGNDVHKID